MRKNLKLMTLPDGGGAPEGRRERKSWHFSGKYSVFPDSNLVRWPRSPAKIFGSPSYLSLSGSAAAPPSGGAKPWPYRGTRRGWSISHAPAAASANLGILRFVHTPRRGRIDAFRNPSVCSGFDRSACPQVLPPPDGAMSST